MTTIRKEARNVEIHMGGAILRLGILRWEETATEAPPRHPDAVVVDENEPARKNKTSPKHFGNARKAGQKPFAERVLEVLADGTPRKQFQISRALGRSSNQLSSPERAHLAALVDNGDLERLDDTSYQRPLKED